MKVFVKWMFFALIVAGWTAAPAISEDIRRLSVEARKAREALEQKIAAEKAEAEKAAAESRARIAKDRAALEKAIRELETRNRALTAEITDMTEELVRSAETEKQFIEKLVQTDSMVNELVGVIRVNAKDIDALISQNPIMERKKDGVSFLATVAEDTKFPGMDDIRSMVAALRGLTQSQEEVSFRKGVVVDRSGAEANADILFLGPFTSLYRIGEEVGFLNFSPESGKLYALSKLPPARMQKQIAQYMAGLADTVPMDISRGGALRQLTHELSLFEQVPKGGPIVWPILTILGVGILIILERVFFLMRKRFNADKLIRQIEELSDENNWEACKQACAKYAKKPVSRVVRAGLLCCHMQREEMENALQEAILKEIPPMERFLSTLGMLAAIAPLLGLLGTVTGMIDTFHVITLHGTGDPRLMSGGISEALVTTMLGLSVAIPLMLAQTLLSRGADKAIGQMEEKAVTLVNIVHKSRGAAA